MKKEILYKTFDTDPLRGGYDWSIGKVSNSFRQNYVYSEPYYVEIPDEFHLAETQAGNMMYFKDGVDRAYTLTIGNGKTENGNPYLIGGSPVESIKLKVLGPVPENELTNAVNSAQNPVNNHESKVQKAEIKAPKM